MVSYGRSCRLSAVSVNKHYKPKRCPRCGSVFVPLSGRALYCFSCRR
ncbi:hypothetical protein SAMN02745219_02609 [Desulfofundulus thermosubterraneus DSM 16057]|uniref:Uncharacterized protein n=1 Tax=Desulfofundulus thermosubterraneus DSM 16057 TaxID=1121432 RepID=A0A1M6JGG6_9FIRM|nr:hypothetical protein SAMN02745219_02609 [Desulfofundulus thermosubterraneus DSM 16057]